MLALQDDWTRPTTFSLTMAQYIHIVHRQVSKIANKLTFPLRLGMLSPGTAASCCSNDRVRVDGTRMEL